jgi:hypothetical protein
MGVSRMRPGPRVLGGELAPEVGEGVWFLRSALCGTPADTRDPLGACFTIVGPEQRCPN